MATLVESWFDDGFDSELESILGSRDDTPAPLSREELRQQIIERENDFLHNFHLLTEKIILPAYQKIHSELKKRDHLCRIGDSKTVIKDKDGNSQMVREKICIYFGANEKTSVFKLYEYPNLVYVCKPSSLSIEVQENTAFMKNREGGNRFYSTDLNQISKQTVFHDLVEILKKFRDSCGSEHKRSPIK